MEPIRMKIIVEEAVKGGKEGRERKGVIRRKEATNSK